MENRRLNLSTGSSYPLGGGALFSLNKFEENSNFAHYISKFQYNIEYKNHIILTNKLHKNLVLVT